MDKGLYSLLTLLKRRNCLRCAKKSRCGLFGFVQWIKPSKKSELLSSIKPPNYSRNHSIMISSPENQQFTTFSLLRWFTLFHRPFPDEKKIRKERKLWEALFSLSLGTTVIASIKLKFNNSYAKFFEVTRVGWAKWKWRISTIFCKLFDLLIWSV